MGMGASTVGTIESGSLLPSFELLLVICETLQVTPNDLLGIPNWAYNNEIKRRFNEHHAEERVIADPESVGLRVG